MYVCNVLSRVHACATNVLVGELANWRTGELEEEEGVVLWRLRFCLILSFFLSQNTVQSI